MHFTHISIPSPTLQKTWNDLKCDGVNSIQDFQLNTGSEKASRVNKYSYQFHCFSESVCIFVTILYVHAGIRPPYKTGLDVMQSHPLRRNIHTPHAAQFTYHCSSLGRFLATKDRSRRSPKQAAGRIRGRAAKSCYS